jgi:hypothetical protein
MSKVQKISGGPFHIWEKGKEEEKKKKHSSINCENKCWMYIYINVLVCSPPPNRKQNMLYSR